jgi:formylglycine-generating enzyme required for sulfatase activity
MKRKMMMMTLLLAGAVAPAVRGQTNLTSPQIQNLVSVQRPGTMLVDVRYDLIDPDSSVVFVSGIASTDGGATYSLPILSVSGDAGWVVPGTGKKLVWNAWNDWAGNYTTNAKVRLTADDADSANGPVPTNAPGPNLTYIPSGTFNMSGTLVYLSHSFWMGKYEVTQAEFMQFMTNNPSTFQNNTNLPVESVTWDEATNYCGLLTARERVAGHITTNQSYRLPTEAEWEYACRARSTTLCYFGDDPSSQVLTRFAWNSVNSNGRTQLGGQKIPNRWGLFDMLGNVAEWCSDRFGSLPGGNVTDPTGSEFGTNRDLRGCAYQDSPGLQAWYSSYREFNSPPDRRSSALGFRVVLAPAQ